MMIGRTYVPHRRAYTPSLWPPVLVSTGIMIGVVSLFRRPNVFVIVGVALVLSFVTGWMRWAIWRRRHPCLSADEYAHEWARRMRDSARWN